MKDAVLEKIQKVAQILQPGDPLDPKTRMGAMVDETQMNRVLGYIEAGAKEGARLAFGGRRARAETGGYYVEPTVFDGVKTSMRIAQEEIFGPVLSTITFKDQAEAVTLANDAIYGLAAAVWTSDVNKAFRISAPCAPAWCGSTASTTGTPPRRSAASSNPTSAATSRCTRWTNALS